MSRGNRESTEMHEGVFPSVLLREGEVCWGVGSTPRTREGEGPPDGAVIGQ